MNDRLTYVPMNAAPVARKPRMRCILFIAAAGCAMITAPLLFFTTPPHPPLSSVIFDRSGTLLNAHIASDGQWRFPPDRSVPQKYAEAVIAYEDRRFFIHPGVDPLALARAAFVDLKSGCFVQGGSTLTMQLIRLQQGKKKRTIPRKIIEIIGALRESVVYSKQSTLARYASLAPFGGNVVGLRAAAWRYFECDPSRLSWAQAATLAVLPNSPGLVHPGRNRDRLRQKRDRLLAILYSQKKFDSLTYALALAEPLPDRPYPLPSLAPHLLERCMKEVGPGRMVTTTIDASLQQHAVRIVERHVRRLAENHICNAAVLIADVWTGATRVYVGNTDPTFTWCNGQGCAVDIITAPRSTGSILKPFLFGCMVHEGVLLPRELVADIPTFMGGFAPQNFHRTFEGAVPAYRALARSLNVPAVRMLQHYGVEKFTERLKWAGMTTLTRPPSEYGMSLILGGAETTLWDIAGMYASLARTVVGYARNFPRDTNLYFPLSYRPDSPRRPHGVPATLPIIGPGAAYLTIQALLDVARPEEEGAWFEFASGKRIAWKTGTSYGNRDGWAIGVTPTQVIAVWVGNASGEGRPGLTGTACAAPLLFDLLNLLPQGQWFARPEADLVPMVTCASSGMRASINCAQVCTTAVPEAGRTAPACSYCRIVHLDTTMRFHVNADCYPAHAIRQEKRFVLPPSMEWFYKQKQASYRELPPWHPRCGVAAYDRQRSFSIIYPQDRSTVYIPIELSGKRGSLVFQAATRTNQQTLYWHVDEHYIGATQQIHRLEYAAGPGVHTLTVVSERGEELRHRFTVLAR